MLLEFPITEIGQAIRDSRHPKLDILGTPLIVNEK